MARAWIWGSCVLALMPMVALAQQSDTQQILELLKNMNGRFDQIEERLDRVEQGGAAASAPGVGTLDVSPKPDAPSSAPAPVQPTSNGVAVPGWKIDVLPYTEKGPADAPIARVRAPIGPTFFDLHFDGGSTSNQVSYKGSAYFRVATPGTYVFQLRTIATNNDFRAGTRRCGGSLDIEDRAIIPEFESNSSITQSGSIDLQAGNYSISYRTYCVLSDKKFNVSLNNYGIKALKASGYEIKVLGPDDGGFRLFEPSELFFIAPPERTRAQLQETPQVQPSGSITSVPSKARDLGGRGGTLTADANFRAAPSRSSHSMGELRAGLGFRVLEQVDSWYRVRLRDGNEGYVHASLVALQN